MIVGLLLAHINTLEQALICVGVVVLAVSAIDHLDK